MSLQKLWEKYRQETVFNYSVLPEELRKKENAWNWMPDV